MNVSGYRVEKDFLGEKQVPRDRYYGVQTERARENFPITGQSMSICLFRALGVVKKAAALANMETGYLDTRIGGAIVAAAEEVASGQLDSEFVVDAIQGGAGTSINMNVNEVIANRALEILGKEKGDYKSVHPNNHVNMSQSTNDAVPTAARIALLACIEELAISYQGLHRAFRTKAEEFNGVIKMGRTHLQDAVPIRLGQEFSAYADVVARDLDRIGESKKVLYELNMGATAVGTGMNADPEYIDRVVQHIRKITGHPVRSARNLVDATQNTDAYLVVSATLRNAAVSLCKIANDIRLMASGPASGLGEISLPPVQPGSSIMPGKVNPVMAEAVNQVAFQIIGNDTTIVHAAAAGQLELNVMVPVLLTNLFASIKILNNVVRLFTEKCVAGITANEKRCRELMEKSSGIITAICPHVGYEMACKLAREALRSGKPVLGLLLEKQLFSKKELENMLDPFVITTPGIHGAKIS
ncbi:MAG: aspartate ammonia-lyase [Bacillota bacterium]